MKATFYNILSNIVARLWAVGIGIILLPIYANIIGMESYGLVGFYSTLMGSLTILDLGLSSTLTREMARSKTLNVSAQSVCNLVYSLEIIYWGVGIVIGIGVVFLAPIIATSWVKSDHLSVSQITNSVMLMGGVVAFQWPQSIYTGGLMGLQKQVPYNIAIVILSTLKSVGVVVILKLVAPTVQTFFIWQIFVSFLSAFILRYLLWKYVPQSENKAVFSKVELTKIWRFAAGMTGIGLATFCLSQIDKVVLSKVLSLKEYGYYMLAWTVGTSILIVISILGNTLLPKMTAIVARGNEQEIIVNYHRFNRLMASAVVPVGVLLCLFSKEIIGIWTHNAETTNAIWVATSILTAGSICNAFMNVPYYLMLANGWTRFTIYQNIIASIILTPLLFWWTSKWGFTGASLVWFSVNFGYNIISLPLIHRTLLKGELFKVYIYDMGISIVCSLVVIGTAKIVCLNSKISLLIQLGTMISSLAITYICIMFFSVEYKKILYQLTKKYMLLLTK